MIPQPEVIAAQNAFHNKKHYDFPRAMLDTLNYILDREFAEDQEFVALIRAKALPRRALSLGVEPELRNT